MTLKVLILKICIAFLKRVYQSMGITLKNSQMEGFLLDLQIKRDQTTYSQQTLCWRNKNGKLVKDWLSGNEMNALLRYNLHQVETDIFIPCGGRPATLNINNYSDFLNQNTEPTSRAIIEGANLYITPKARHALEEFRGPYC